jgi:hypothetical protein
MALRKPQRGGKAVQGEESNTHAAQDAGSIPRNLRGMENIMMDYVLEPELVQNSFVFRSITIRSLPTGQWNLVLMPSGPATTTATIKADHGS